jgi:hypothetical protein
LIPLPAQSGNITAKPLSISAILANKTYGTALTSGSGFTGFNAVGAVGAENPGTVNRNLWFQAQQPMRMWVLIITLLY